jgi:predicted transcriptional regulator of viral defense system
LTAASVKNWPFTSNSESLKDIVITFKYVLKIETIILLSYLIQTYKCFLDYSSHIDKFFRMKYNIVKRYSFKIIVITIKGEFMREKKIEKAKVLFENNEMIVKSSILNENKFCSNDIAELVRVGFIQRIKPGYFIWSEALNDISDIELAAAVLPAGVVCLYSAAAYYELTTVNPMSVNIALPNVGKPPVLPEHPPVELFKIRRPMFEIGITEVDMAYGKMRIYDKERVVCDFIRLRHQLGEDVALEVLRNYMNGAKNIQKLYEYAEKMRIKSVIRPYVEALL